MADIINGKYFTSIKAPDLTSSQYGNDINEVFKAIDQNFQKIVTLPFVKGDDGSAIEHEIVYIWTLSKSDLVTDLNKCTFTEIGAKLYNTIFANSITETINEENGKSLVRTKELNWTQETTYETFKKDISSLYSNNTIWDAIGPVSKERESEAISISLYYKIDIDNNKIYLGSPQLFYFLDPRLKDITRGEFPEGVTLENFKDLSCILSTVSTLDLTNTIRFNFEKLVGWPTLYYQNGQFNWRVNGIDTGINAQGVKGQDGDGSRIWIAKGEYGPGTAIETKITPFATSNAQDPQTSRFNIEAIYSYEQSNWVEAEGPHGYKNWSRPPKAGDIVVYYLKNKPTINGTEYQPMVITGFFKDDKNPPYILADINNTITYNNNNIKLSHALNSIGNPIENKEDTNPTTALQGLFLPTGITATNKEGNFGLDTVQDAYVHAIYTDYTGEKSLNLKPTRLNAIQNPTSQKEKNIPIERDSTTKNDLQDIKSLKIHYDTIIGNDNIDYKHIINGTTELKKGTNNIKISSTGVSIDSSSTSITTTNIMTIKAGKTSITNTKDNNIDIDIPNENNLNINKNTTIYSKGGLNTKGSITAASDIISKGGEIAIFGSNLYGVHLRPSGDDNHTSYLQFGKAYASDNKGKISGVNVQELEQLDLISATTNITGNVKIGTLINDNNNPIKLYFGKNSKLTTSYNNPKGIGALLEYKNKELCIFGEDKIILANNNVHINLEDEIIFNGNIEITGNVDLSNNKISFNSINPNQKNNQWGSISRPIYIDENGYFKTCQTVEVSTDSSLFLTSQDDRPDNHTTGDYDKYIRIVDPAKLKPGLRVDFISNTDDAINVPKDPKRKYGHSWVGILSYRPYSYENDWSGGGAYQLAFLSDSSYSYNDKEKRTGPETLWFRGSSVQTGSNVPGAIWNNWQRVLTVDHLDNLTLNGTSTINKIYLKNSPNLNIEKTTPSKHWFLRFGTGYDADNSMYINRCAIQTKKNTSTTDILYLNPEGGQVNIGSGGLTTTGNIKCDVLDGETKYFYYWQTKDWNCNNPECMLYSDYGSKDKNIQNAPPGWYFGQLFTIPRYENYNNSLSAQFMWDVQHKTDNPGKLWFRTKDSEKGWKTWGKVILTGPDSTYNMSSTFNGNIYVYGNQETGNNCGIIKCENSKNIGVRILGYGDTGYLQFGSTDSAKAKTGWIGGMNGATCDTISIASNLLTISGDTKIGKTLTVSGTDTTISECLHFYGGWSKTWDQNPSNETDGERHWNIKISGSSGYGLYLNRTSIQSKGTGYSNQLFLNPEGGQVNIGSGGMKVSGNLKIDKDKCKLILGNGVDSKLFSHTNEFNFADGWFTSSEYKGGNGGTMHINYRGASGGGISTYMFNKGLNIEPGDQLANIQCARVTCNHIQSSTCNMNLDGAHDGYFISGKGAQKSSYVPQLTKGTPLGGVIRGLRFNSDGNLEVFMYNTKFKKDRWCEIRFDATDAPGAALAVYSDNWK